MSTFESSGLNSNLGSSILDTVGPESKSTMLNLSLTSTDLVDKVDFNDSISKQNIIYTELINGKIETRIRIPNNVLIYKSDLQDMPLLMEVVTVEMMTNDYIALSSFSQANQIRIALIFMQYYGYVQYLNNELYFTRHLETLFNTKYWTDIFALAKNKTIKYIEEEIKIGNQPSKNKELIQESGLFSVELFKTIQPVYKADTLWALSIYFFDKIIRNWSEQEEREIPWTDTIMDIDFSPAKYTKLMDAKEFFLTQLRIYLSLRPDYIFFGGNYFSKFKEFIQQKSSNISQAIILEELQNFTDFMNEVFSGGNNILMGSNDSKMEPFAVTDVIYNEVEDGVNIKIVLNIVLKINTYKNSQVYTLPIVSRLN